MKDKMKNIRIWFENDANNNEQHYDIYENLKYSGHLEAKTNIAFFMIIGPHSGTDNKWMLRVAPLRSFDRWANSTAVEEFFSTDKELCNYLTNHQLDIYKAMLRRLSDDYEEIDNFNQNCD